MKEHITNIEQVYELVGLIKVQCNFDRKICLDIDSAIDSGSTGLEILGAIKGALETNSIKINAMIDEDTKEEISSALMFIANCYGQR